MGCFEFLKCLVFATVFGGKDTPPVFCRLLSHFCGSPGKNTCSTLGGLGTGAGGREWPEGKAEITLWGARRGARGATLEGDSCFFRRFSSLFHLALITHFWHFFLGSLFFSLSSTVFEGFSHTIETFDFGERGLFHEDFHLLLRHTSGFDGLSSFVEIYCLEDLECFHKVSRS